MVEFIDTTVSNSGHGDISEFSHEILTLFTQAKGRGYIAGGFASELFGKGKAGDIDLWPTSHANFLELAEEFRKLGYEELHDSELALTFQPHFKWDDDKKWHKVQLIKFDDALPLNTPERLILYFDLSPVQFVITDIEAVQFPMVFHIRTTLKSMEDMVNNRVSVTRMGNPIIRAIRLAKYARKGFSVTQKTWAEVTDAVRGMPSHLAYRTHRFMTGQSENRRDDERYLRDGYNTLAPDIQDAWKRFDIATEDYMPTPPATFSVMLMTWDDGWQPVDEDALPRFTTEEDAVDRIRNLDTNKVWRVAWFEEDTEDWICTPYVYTNGLVFRENNAGW